VTNGQSQLPSGAEINYGSGSADAQPTNIPYSYHLVYTNGSGSIIYNQLYVYYNDITVLQSSPIPRSLPTSPSPSNGNTNPSIACYMKYGSNVGVAWENTANHWVYYRESADNGNNWGTVKELKNGTNSLSQPSVSFMDSVTVLFQMNNHIGKVVKNLSSGGWSSVVDLGSGTGPNLPSCSYEIVPAIWTIGSATPYTINITTISGLGKKGRKTAAMENIPDQFDLLDNYPNPFNPTTTIKYQLPGARTRYVVSLRVYDILGREISTLADGIKEAGYYTATFDASHMASGIYFARITATPQDGGKPFAKVMKMLMMK
jgi:hypothetical protein